VTYDATLPIYRVCYRQAIYYYANAKRCISILILGDKISQWGRGAKSEFHDFNATERRAEIIQPAYRHYARHFHFSARLNANELNITPEELTDGAHTGTDSFS